MAGIAAGVLGGIVGSTAMVLFNRCVAASGLASSDVGRHHQQHHLRGKPNDIDGTISDEPASIKVTSGAVKALTGVQPSEWARYALGEAYHHAFGAAVGGIYGAAAVRYPMATALGGAPYGIAVWAAAAEIGLPLAGLARRPTAYPVARHAASLATHIIFGLTLDVVRRNALRAWRRG